MNEEQANNDDTFCRRHYTGLREMVSLVIDEMDSALSRCAITREHIDRWGTMLRETLGCEYTDSAWLESIGFVRLDGDRPQYRMNNWLTLRCDAGQWNAYVKSGPLLERLCSVDKKEEVLNLIKALKLKD